VTSDGWGIALVRYQAKGTPSGPPVILCHGVAANARNMDLDDDVSMARWFAAHGRETWTVSLRGGGDSDRPDEAAGRPAGFDFDDYWKKDLPAVITYVRKVSGAKAIDWVGHSMGGMVLYAYLAEGGEGINAATTMGSPTRLDWGTGVEGPLLAAAPKLQGLRFTVPASLGAHAMAPIDPHFDDGPMERFFYNPQSTSKRSWQRLIAYGTSDISSGVLMQLASVMRDGAMKSADGAIDFKKDMARITTPVLVVAAKLDRVAITPAVKDGYRALGGPKEWLLITRANGARGEYGHMDLVIGDRAADEVWSKVLDFLNRHAPKEP
jgi:poly(3-hydroxyalkanoate) synthetase